jgi:hypothetical protein
LASLRLTSLDAEARLGGGDLALRRAFAEFYGGRVTGDFAVRLSPAPSYAFRGEFDRTNLAALAATTPALEGRFAGVASGDLTLSARGSAKPDLAASLQGEGSWRIRDAVARGFDLADLESGAPETRPDSRPDSRAHNEGRLGAVTAKFRIASRQIHLEPLLFAGREARYEVVGDVDFSRRLTLAIRPVPGTATALAESDPPAARDSWIVAGTADSPFITRPTSVARGRLPATSARR